MSANANLVPTTELEAVNICLSAIGEAPVSTLNVTGLSDATLAVAKVREASRALQARGWSFNRDNEMPQTRTVEGYFVLPANALHADISRSENRDGVWRAGKLWDKEKFTFVWDKDLKLDFIWFLAFDDLPETARQYIAVRAARMFARAALGSVAVEAFSDRDETLAWVSFRRDENRASDRNVFRNNMMLDRSPNHVYIP